MAPAEPAGSVSFVTGADHRVFDQLFLLMGSISRYCPGTRLLVCDFGLTQQQQDLLRRKSILLERPADLPGYPHAWYYKAALGRYVSGLNTRSILWIDADMMILSDIRPLIDNLDAGMAATGAYLAAAGNETIGEQNAIDPAPRFASLAAAFHPNARYLNSGFFLCRSATFLEDWYQLCRTMPIEKLFEQNSFNLIAHAAPDNVRIIDMLTWNMCGPQIRDAAVLASGRDIVITGPHGRTHVLHATSNAGRRDVVVRRLRLAINARVFRLTMRMFSGPEPLLAFQLDLVLDALAENFGLLTACGFGTNT